MAIAVAAIWIGRHAVNTYTSQFHRYYFYYLVNFYTFAFYGIWAQLLMHELIKTEAGQSEIVQQAAALLPLFGAPFLLFSWVALCFSGYTLTEVHAKKVQLGVLTITFGLLLPAGLFLFLILGKPFGGMALEQLQLITISGLAADLAFTLFFGLVVSRNVGNLPAKKRKTIINFCLLICSGFILRALIVPFTFSGPYILALVILLFFLSGIFPLLYLHYKADLVFMPIFADASDHEKKEKLFAHYGISPREREIVDKICEGKTNRQIADELFISLQTVKDHTHRIYSKIGINSRLKLVQLLNE